MQPLQQPRKHKSESTDDIKFYLKYIFDIYNIILFGSFCSSAQQAQNNAAAAAVHAAIHLKELPEESRHESVRHDDYATNHNYSGPGPSSSPATAPNGQQAAPQSGEYEFAGY